MYLLCILCCKENKTKHRTFRKLTIQRTQEVSQAELAKLVDHLCLLLSAYRNKTFWFTDTNATL